MDLTNKRIVIMIKAVLIDSLIVDQLTREEVAMIVNNYNFIRGTRTNLAEAVKKNQDTHR